MYFIYSLLLLLYTTPIHSLDFTIPLPNTLILAGTSSLVTWRDMGNATATNLYLGNGPSKDQLKVISVFGQNIPSSKKSIWITMPKDAPNDNTYLILEGNDSPASRATVPLNIGFGSKTTPSAVPTGPSSSSSSSTSIVRSSTRPSSSVHSSSSSSARPSSISSSSTTTSSHTTTKSIGKPSSHSDSDASSTPSSSDSTTATSSPPSSSSSSESGANLSSGQTAGVTVGVIGAVGLAVGAFFFVRRNRRSDKRSTEVFEGEGYGVAPRAMPPMNDGFYNGYNQPQQQYRMPPPVAYGADSSSTGYPRSFGHTQSPYHSMNPMHDARQNGFQSRTEDNAHYGSPDVLHKPDEIHLPDASNKPHSP